MTIAVVVFTDGRDDLLLQSVASLREQVSGPITERVMYDDTGDPIHADSLRGWFPDFTVISHPEGRQGFGGAIRAAWAWLRRNSEADWIWHAEDDFTYNAPIDLDHIAGVLANNPELLQIALRRQPWNDDERAAGGVVEQHPEAYEERWFWRDHMTSWGAPDPQVHCVLAHRLYWTTNPSLYRRSLILGNDWPVGANSEGRFGLGLLADGLHPDCEAAHPQARCFAFWGCRNDPPLVHHIGEVRAGVGY